MSTLPTQSLMRGYDDSDQGYSSGSYKRNAAKESFGSGRQDPKGSFGSNISFGILICFKV
jgi:hypothetical protein